MRPLDAQYVFVQTILKDFVFIRNILLYKITLK
jgi:hypothetical protein